MKAQVKGITMVFMAALLLSAASCKKETKEETEYEGGFTAKAEAQQNDSKVYLVGTGLEWNATESIMVFNYGGTGQKFTSYKVYIDEANFKPDFEGGEEPEDFDETFYKDGGYTAYYPCPSSSSETEDGSYSLTLPATQTYTVCDNHPTFDRNAFLMAGKTGTTEADDRFIYFKNICGLLELSFYTQITNCKVKTITLTSNNANDHLSGSGEVTFGEDGFPTIALDGGNVLTLDCSDYNNHQGVTLSTSESSPTVFYFVVPAGTLGSGFSVEVETDHGNFKKTAPANEIERNKMKQMPKLEVKVSSVPEGALSGKFTIGTNSRGKEIQVYFSNGNLQYNPKQNKWRFAENQYKMIHNYYVDPYYDARAEYTSDYNGWIDLFGWGTSGFKYEDEQTHPSLFYQPWSWGGAYFYYGPLSGDLTVDGLSDWGANTISNAVGNGWRTLSKDEWDYLLNVRKVNGKTAYKWNPYNPQASLPAGLIVYCDDYTDATPDSDSDGIPDGCLFLPAAGYRVDGGIYNVQTFGEYWTSTHSDVYESCAYGLQFFNGTVALNSNNVRSTGLSVRLVRFVETN